MVERSQYEIMLEEDKALVHAIREGGRTHTGVHATLYRKYRQQVADQVSAALYRWGGNQEDVEDLMHEAFLVMLKKIRNGGYKKGALLHFWTGIAKGLLSNKLKRDWKLDLTDDELALDGIEPNSPEEVYLDEERRQNILRILSTVGERCLRVLLLWMDNYTMQEIADALSLSSDAMARKIKHQCLKKLREMLKGRYTETKNRIT